jgi:hypothetical protein
MTVLEQVAPDVIRLNFWGQYDVAPILTDHFTRRLTPERVWQYRAALFTHLCHVPTDVTDHLPLLYALARECQHVTEMGVHYGNSTVALLQAQPRRLVSYDIVRTFQVNVLELLAGQTDFTFHQASTLEVEIEPTEMLFIDSQHTYDQLSQELALHGGKVAKYIVMHDTETFGEHGFPKEIPGIRGLKPAIEEFTQRGEFAVKFHIPQCNGLTVLERCHA